MKHALLFLFIPISVVFGQQPFGHNATWHKSFNGYINGDGVGYAKIYHHKDSIINGNTYQWMQEYRQALIQTGPDPLNDIALFTDRIVRNFFYRTIGDTVYHYTFDLSRETLLYDFSAQVGDTVYFRDTLLYTSLDCFHLPGYVVTGRGSEIIDGQPMEYWDIDSIYHGGEFLTGNRIYREMGVLRGSGGTSLNTCSEMPSHANLYNFRCFTNNDIHYQTTWTEECDFFSSISVDAHKRESLLTIYPNPTNDVLHLNISEELKNITIEVTDMQGRKVIQQSMENAKDESLIVDHLRSGVYVLHIADVQGQTLFMSKWVKR